MKTFLSIGTGPGMGIETAERFAREGFRVVLSARSADKTQKLSEALKGKGHQVEVRTVDASDLSSIAGLVGDVEREFGSVDVLHYNAASMRNQNLVDQPVESFNSDLVVNVGGALAAAKAAVPKMVERGSGTILLTGGGFALQPHPDFLSLSIGKAGLRAMAQGLFNSLKEKGVHVATVTVAGLVIPGTKQAADVGEAFWTLHSQPKESWTVETVYEP